MATSSSEMIMQQENIRQKLIEQAKKGFEVSLDGINERKKLVGLSYNDSISQLEFSELNRLLQENYPITALQFNIYVKYCSGHGMMSNYAASCSPLSQEGIQFLANVLAINHTITYLHFGISPGVGYIISGVYPYNSYVGHKGIGNQGAEIFAKALMNNYTLTHLLLEYNDIGLLGTVAIVKALSQNKTIRYLSLSGNKLDDECANILAKNLLTNRTITHMNLGSNSISSKGAEALEDALSINCTLTYLNLSYNKIGDAGAIALANALQASCSLTHIKLNRCNIGNIGAKALEQALLKNKFITYLELDGNDSIESELRRTIKNLVQHNNVIQFLPGNKGRKKEPASLLFLASKFIGDHLELKIDRLPVNLKENIQTYRLEKAKIKLL